MRTPSIPDLLRAWERGLDQRPIQRALTLLAAAWPDTPPDVLAGLSIGQRDARLLTLRESIFGPHLASLAICPDCSESLELSFDVADIRVAPEIEPAAELTASIEGYEVRFRLPNSRDLVAASNEAISDTMCQVLLQRCLLAVIHDDKAQPVNQLPTHIEQAIVERMANCDAQADIELTFTCPACEHQWQARFDIVSYLWTELDAWVCRILREVHVLASAYGWREDDILALGPRRRQIYLDMISA
jgi:hypothetical protein